jgi:hypothetical protein
VVWHLLVLSPSPKLKTGAGSFSEAWVNFFKVTSCYVLTDVDIGDVININMLNVAKY